MALKQPDLIWFTKPGYNDTRLNIENTNELTNYWTADRMLSEPVNTGDRPYRIGEVIYNVLQNDNNDILLYTPIKYPGQVMSSYLFNYGDMVGDLTVVSGLQKPLSEVEKELNYTRIVSGAGVFANVTGIIARQPYVDADGVTFNQFAAYFDNL